MPRSDYEPLLNLALQNALTYLDGLRERPVARPVDYRDFLERMGGPLPVEGEDPVEVARNLFQTADPGIVATAGPRYFGFVTGGSLPVTVAAEWMASAWDQNGFSYVQSPAATSAEEMSRIWMLELLGLPPHLSLGITTGGTMANFTALAAARHALLERQGWDVEARGLIGSPGITVVTSDESHVSIFAALKMLGLGHSRVTRLATDDQGRMRPEALRDALLRVDGPFLVCAQAGNVNSGAFDPLPEIAAIVHERAGWLHVDGAFGLWAAASPSLRRYTLGAEHGDSIVLDGHKWLNVPYDCGFVFVKDRKAHHAAMTMDAPYYQPGPDETRDNHNWVPEASRRARGFGVYAALRSLGRSGLAAMVERCCALARRFADRLRGHPGVEILNDVVLNQVMVRFTPPGGGDPDAFTAEVIRRVQRDGTCWLGGTSWHDMRPMRISVSNWSTTEEDIDRSADAILRCSST